MTVFGCIMVVANVVKKSRRVSRLELRLKDDELETYVAVDAYTADKETSTAAYLKAYVRQAELCAYLPTDGVQTYCLRNKKVKGLNTTSTFIWSQSMATAYIDD